jgi:acetyl-CoA acetyltransferase family protein
VPVRNAVIVDAVRSPMAAAGAEGLFSGLDKAALFAHVLSGLLDRTGVDPGIIDGLLVGCTRAQGEEAVSLGRRAWMVAGLPGEAPSTALERGVDIGSQAVHLAVQRVLAEDCGVVVAGGVESGSSSANDGNPSVFADLAAAEMVCTGWKFTRSQLDDYASRSRRRAAAVAAAGEFRAEIVPINVWTSEVCQVVCEDSTFRSDLSAEALVSLPTSGERRGQSFPRVTIGNSALPADGASAVLISDERRVRDLGLRARARIRSAVVAVPGDDPLTLFTEHISATATVLEGFSLGPQQVDHFEVVETSAAVPLAWQAAFGLIPDLLNPRGGAIALGHSPGASCARMLTTMLNALEATGGRYGLQVMGVHGGLAPLFVVERL